MKKSIQRSRTLRIEWLATKGYKPVEINGRHLLEKLGCLGFALLLLLNSAGAKAQNKKNNCNHPPKMLSQPSLSDEDRAKWKGKAISGKVALVINEDGDVAEAKVVSAAPRDAAEPLLNAVKRAKFAPRLGCGDLKTEVIFNLDR